MNEFRVTRASAAIAVVGALLLQGCGVAPAAVADDEWQDSLPSMLPSSGDTLQLVFEREVFSYPSFQRRNPFGQLTGEESGPRFEELELSMVILTEDNGSVATLRMRGTAGRSGAAARSFRVREGDILGNMRIAAIRLREIVIDVDEFGQRERRVLELRRSAPEAVESDADPDDDDDSDIDPPMTIPPDTTITSSGNGNNWNGGSE